MSKFDIATEMNGIMASPVYQSIFTKPEPQFTKMAAKKEDDKERAAKEKAKAKAEAEKAKEKAAKEKAKEKAEKEKAKEKADKEKAKAKAAAKKKAMTKYESCIKSLCNASEILDEAGLAKASALALLALDNLVKTAAKKKEEAKDKGKGKDKKKEEDKKAAEKKKEEAKNKSDKNDAKGLPPWLKKKDDKAKPKGKDDKKDDKKKPTTKKASNDGAEVIDCGDMGMAEDSDDNKEFEQLMKELEEPSEDDGDWSILDQPAEAEKGEGEIDLEDPEIESLVEGLGEGGTEEPNLDELTRHVAAGKKKTSLQKLAEELGKGFLA